MKSSLPPQLPAKGKVRGTDESKRNLAILGCSGLNRARFWTKVDKSPHPKGCWVWTASKTEAGYGQFSLPPGTVVIAHRVSYFLANGKLPSKGFACHTCDNPACVNPSHLFDSDNQGNVRDMVAKGRGAIPKGEKSPNSKLTAAQVLEIRSIYPAQGSSREIGLRYGVAGRTIRDIAARIQWKHLP